MSETAITRIVIVGGGTAGWLSACLLAARLDTRGIPAEITLVEAPDIPTVGVGEGTWPTMRGTLADIGIGEKEFLLVCDASFKQGSRFEGWVTGAPGDSYLHPFTPPPTGDLAPVLAAWAQGPDVSFAEAMSAQYAQVVRNLAPRQPGMPDYAGALNYAYHLDAGKFAALLRRHATGRLGVHHVSDRVTGIATHASGDIAALHTAGHGELAGDLFIDCSGNAALLIGAHFGVGWIDRSDVLLNDRALAVQVPTAPGSAIASATVATAHAAGWTWDIALPTRRGIGCIYSSRFLDDAGAEAVLRGYVAAHVPGADFSELAPRRIAFPTGHRKRFWERNCVAIGLSAGFLEPLEASAIVLIELSLQALCENFPRRRDVMDFHAARFNALFRYRWDRVVEFLKLHYILSQRLEPYWLAQRQPDSIPSRLAELIALWRDQAPSQWDFPQVDEIFPAASHQYVLYGMGTPPPPSRLAGRGDVLNDVRRRARALAAALPTNRAYLDPLCGGHAMPAESLA